MLRRVLKVAGGLVAVLVLIAAAGGGWAVTHWRRTFEAPVPDIHASTDTAIIARGRYLAYGPAHCVECHTNQSAWDSVLAGHTPLLAGGKEFLTPVGTFRTPNLTPDSAHGIGRVSDGQLARVLRYGVRPDGRVVVPFMEFQDLSDEDLTALLSFLRSQQPVARTVPDHDINFMGKLVLAFLMKPAGPARTPPTHSPADSATVERGAYLANTVAACVACHTKRNEMDGSNIGEKFAGGGEFRDDSILFVSPNLTRAHVGRITEWTEDQFLARFRAGSLLPGTPMPWTLFRRMSDNDVRAIFRYLRTLPPVEVDPGQSMRKAGT